MTGYGILWGMSRKKVARSQGGSMLSDLRHHHVGFHNGCFRGTSAAVSGAPPSLLLIIRLLVTAVLTWAGSSLKVSLIRISLMMRDVEASLNNY